ncbi:uncharacterized protein LOC122505182 [Leptopilina heterotoma]|uniref:uncharacterized protein LOC122505182 n=1 Tax=Leptopilina heterotoma TaxID=63436 RepID=UPI001CA9C48A|nr:uncharacterized protein LOC122505182 [Leptopilina heterotoma]
MATMINFSELEKEVFPNNSIILENYFKGNLLFLITIPKQTLLNSSEFTTRATLQECPKTICIISFKKISNVSLTGGVKISRQSGNQEFAVTLYYLNSERKIDLSETINVPFDISNTVHSFVNSYKVLQANQSLPIANQVPVQSNYAHSVFGPKMNILYAQATPVTYSHLPNKFIGDNLHILCKIEIKNAPEMQNAGKTKSFQKFVSMFQEKVFTDFKIISNGQEFSVHKAVLAHSSPVFRRMLENPLKESQTNQVEINSFEANIIEQMIHFMYSDELKIDEELSQETLKELFLVANVYQLENLRKLCLKKICESTKDLSGVIDVILLAGSENKEEMINFLKDIRFTLMVNK